MKAGVSCKDITPPVRTRLADHTRYSTGIHDPLFVKPLVLDDGETAVAIVCIDLLNGSFEFCDEMRRQIEERTGIKHSLINFLTDTFGAGNGRCPRRTVRKGVD